MQDPNLNNINSLDMTGIFPQSTEAASVGYKIYFAEGREGNRFIPEAFQDLEK